MNNIIRLFFKSKLIFRRPERKPVLIFRGDGRNSIIFYDYIDKSKVTLLNAVSKEINVYILISSIMSSETYYQKYVNYVKPKIFLTFIDNAMPFLSINAPDRCRKISVQNGYRSAINDLYYNLEKVNTKDLSVDYAFFYNSAIAQKFKKLISCKALTTGSFLSNKTPICQENIGSDIVFVSQYRSFFHKPNIVFSGGVTSSEFVKYEILFIKWMFSFFSKKNQKIKILGSVLIGAQEEELFFKGLSNGVKFDFIVNNKFRKTYNIVDKARMIISIDSTLGYEALSRGSKVAMFAGIRGKSYPLNTKQYGWPTKLPKKGLFWTNSINPEEWEKVIHFVDNVSIQKWHYDCDKYIYSAISRDINNKKFVNIVKKIDSTILC